MAPLGIVIEKSAGMRDDDFILEADDSQSPRPCQLTGWEVVIFELAEETEDRGPRTED